MALKKSEKRLLIILGIAVFVFVLDKFILKSGKEQPPQAAVTPTEVKSTTVSAGEKATAVKTQKNENVVRFDTWGRDPFAVTASASKGSSKRANRKYKLKAIIKREGRSLALINDMIIAEGEEKKGLKVTRITDNSVVCMAGGKTINLKLEGR